ncbi:DUF707 domain-containing protein [Rhizobium hainanense]|uniref:DUF707 domain-containing protein n=1 Tax=Rhizobium hainanense TaxID=52131 RepID=A0A1C3TXM3_9HYPH|nr:DUF707 domain-containing protein [Rhizobium hainanense]SCB07961.1 hypothetical protein GA0061100_101236 [Rhizobium hainanense]
MSLAANSLHTPAYGAHPASQIQWSDAPPLTQDMLSGTFWSLGDVNRGMFARFVVLAPDGMIGNYFDPAVDFWHVMGGRLCLIDRDGLPSVIFDSAHIENGNLMAFAGRGVVGGVDATYLLVPADHPPHPLFSTPAGVERRATFLTQPQEGLRRPNLVVVPAGSKSLHPRWFEKIDDASRNWDLCIGYYGAETPEVSGSPYEYLAHIPKTKKFKIIYDLFHEGSPLWNYERIWLPDDDLLCDGEDINRMFHLSHKHGLDLAQPSLKKGPGSYPNHPLTVQRPNSVVRFEGFVEIMCPVFSRRALQICIESMRDVESGYGLDHLWPSFLGRPAARMAIIDAISVAHTRPLGATYNVNAAVEEQAALFRTYQYTPLKYAGVW